MGNCHCSMCRKFHGAAFATYGEAKQINFHWLEGEEKLASFKANNGTVRQFCQNCGSSMTFASDDGVQEMIEFSMGTLDSQVEQLPDVHIFTDYKASWYQITGELPKYKGDRNSEKQD